MDKLEVFGEFVKKNYGELKQYDKIQKEKIDYVNELIHYGYGFVYFIITNSKCKIGITTSLHDRIRSLNNILIDDEIKYIYVTKLCSNNKDIENSFKNNFKKNNIFGEWYEKKFITEYINYLSIITIEENFISNKDYNKSMDESRRLAEAILTDNGRLYKNKDINENTTEIHNNINDIRKTIKEITYSLDKNTNISIPHDLFDICAEYSNFMNIDIEEFIYDAVNKYISKLSYIKPKKTGVKRKTIFDN